MRVGLIIPHVEGALCGRTPGWSDILAASQAAEDAGFDSLWLLDHLVFVDRHGGPVRGPWESWSLLAALAASTRRISLGTLVTCTAFRNPALTAKMAETVDEVSGGRFILGLGAGWNLEELRRFGYPTDRLIARFEEALLVIHSLLRHGQVDFDGTFVSARECVLAPRGPRPQGPPLLIGSGTGPRMLGLTAQFADMWNAWVPQHGNDAGRMAPLVTALDAACAARGRDPATLERTAGVLVELPGADPYPARFPGWKPSRDGHLITGSATQIAEALAAFGDEGVAHLQVWLNPWTPQGIDVLAEALLLLNRPDPRLVGAGTQPREAG